MAVYFFVFYASINFGSLFSTIITPYLRWSCVCLYFLAAKTALEVTFELVNNTM